MERTQSHVLQMSQESISIHNITESWMILISTTPESAVTGTNQCTEIQRENFMDAFIHIHKYFNIMVTEMLSIFLVLS